VGGCRPIDLLDFLPVSEWRPTVITSSIQYTLELDDLRAFEGYACLWIRLIARRGGQHHGDILSSDDEKAKSHGRCSFPGMGAEGLRQRQAERGQ
jgi:hypothetical protein